MSELHREKLTNFIATYSGLTECPSIAEFLESMLDEGIQAQIQYGQEIFDWISMSNYDERLVLEVEKDGDPYSMSFVPGVWSIRSISKQFYVVLDVTDSDANDVNGDCIIIAGRGTDPFVPISNNVLKGVSVLQTKVSEPVHREYEGRLEVQVDYNLEDDFAHLTCWYEKGFEPDTGAIDQIERDVRAYVDGAIGLHDFEMLEFMEFCEEGESGDEFGLEFKIKL